MKGAFAPPATPSGASTSPPPFPNECATSAVGSRGTSALAEARDPVVTWREVLDPPDHVARGTFVSSIFTYLLQGERIAARPAAAMEVFSEHRSGETSALEVWASTTACGSSRVSSTRFPAREETPMKPNTNSDAPRPCIPGHRGWAVAVMIFCAISLAGCILDEVEPNGSCGLVEYTDCLYGATLCGEYTWACQSDPTNNRFDYRGDVDPRGFVSADDLYDTWVFRSLASGPQDVWLTVTSGGYVPITIMSCDVEPCDRAWVAVFQARLGGSAWLGDGKKFIGSFYAAENAQFLLAGGGADPASYQVSLRARGASPPCTTDADCFPTPCCDPSACVLWDQSPICNDSICNADGCTACTLDCGQGHCVCQNGECAAVFTSGCP